MRAAVVSLLALSLVVLVACGSGGGTSTPPTPVQPGTARVVALASAVAPDGGGTFLPFPTQVPMDVAAGGWSVFVAATSTLGDVAYVFTPGRALLRVFAEGDAAPDLALGAVGTILRVWVNQDGLVLALFDVVGNPGVTAGLATAQAAEGGVTDRAAVIYTGTSMAATGIAGTLAGFEQRSVHLGSNGRVFFAGETDAFETALWRAQPDGTSLARVVGTGDPLPGGRSVVTVYGTAVDASGTAFAFLAERDDVGGTLALYTGRVGQAVFGEVAAEGDPLATPDELETLPPFQPMVVYAGTAVTVLYKAISNLGEDHLILGIPGQPDELIAREGDADTAITGGTFGALDWLENAGGAEKPLFQAGMSGAQGITFALFSVEQVVLGGGGVTLAIAVYNGRAAPDIDGQAFSTVFPGLGVQARRDASPGSSLAFANVLAPSGQTGLFWLVRGLGLFTTARAGQTIPGGGDTYANDTAWRCTIASGVVLYRAPVTGAGSGIFRRGP